MPDLRDVVTSIEGVGAVDANGDTFIVEWGHTPEDASRLLAVLVARVAGRVVRAAAG